MSSDEGGLDVGLTTGALRAILAVPGSPGSAGGRAEDLARRLGDAIRVGVVLDGERLPSETRLAAQAGVAVTTLREALRILREEGLIETRRGHGGGTVVKAPVDMAAELDRRLRAFTVVDIRDLGDQRSAILSTAAQLAARRALPADIARLEAHLDRLRTARDPQEIRRVDALFTLEVAVSAQSPRLTLDDVRIRAEIGDLLWLDSTREDRTAAVAIRRRLVRAIAAGNEAEAGRLATAAIRTDTVRLARHRITAAAAHGSRASRSGARSRLRAILDEVFTSLRDLGDGYQQLVLQSEAPGGTLRRRELSSLRPAIEKVLVEHRDIVAGAGIVVEPGLLDDVTLWLEWLWRRKDGASEVLRVNVDPRAPDFYDYTEADWFALARRAGRRQVTGPYVDHACTGAYALTLSIPMVDRDRFLGVVAADVLLASVEEELMAHLGRRTERVLATAEGRVIVSASPDLLPGERVTLPGPAPASDWVEFDAGG
jgi:DNA-binding FadR family transcriptional regulator